MEQLGDKLVNSPICDSNACYESEFQTADGPIKTWLCMTSGYTSNTTMTMDSQTLKLTLEHTAITMPDKGMIFPEPKKMGNIEIDTKTGEKTVLEDTMDWCWAVVKAIPIPEEDRERYPDPTNPGTFYKNKMDMKNIKRYNKLEFMDAAEELGMFNPTLVGEIEVSEESSKKIGSEGPSPSESSEK